MSAWLTIIGALPNGALAPNAPQAALDAGAVFGAARLLAAAGIPEAARRPWPRPFADGIAAVLARRGEATTILASGDPLHHGVGATLLRHLPAEEIAVFPAPSAFSLAAAAMRWPLETVTCLSLHAAPPADILTAAAPGRRLLCLTRDGAAPAAIAAILTEAGFGDSTLTVLADLGTAEAARQTARASDLTGEAAPLNVLAVECARRDPVRVADLAHDGCVTRDEIRLLSIAALAPPGHLWDIGAGSGAVAIDWCRAGGSATLFERVPARAVAIRQNLAATHTRATLLEGPAIDHLGTAPDPARIFLGGAVGDDALFEALWARLPAGGILVSNAVTLGGEAATIARQARLGGTLTRIALSHAEPVGRLLAMRPAMPVLQWRVVK
ncbi:precorrin-6y C5,15-methyltransferase (decarboxylating) subunit CbiE [Acuticoccus sp. M5D2P5]|uniref:precorrin-6y C5,15-methyltransferase (decarboxylating) subunit CbiE n=1 Tax=Acuticoccus kalidii TaxID=2910977 RepID=UPI001F32F57E|nr:precorrin-6y C5,15-methyltransferase (decarboxylating) subunit CbiE [Acuticoccus kalidii]MCF3935942.1 precorrin-6y C5,15-methyltransferase (decarboxylating) subunit CbiE [Acuticoccus kalidii]